MTFSTNCARAAYISINSADSVNGSSVSTSLTIARIFSANFVPPGSRVVITSVIPCSANQLITVLTAVLLPAPSRPSITKNFACTITLFNLSF